MDNSESENMIDRSLNGKQQTTLDLFRIVAAMFVMVGHSLSFYEVTVFKDQTYFPYIQNIGVVVFFFYQVFDSSLYCGKKQKHQYTFSLFFKHKALRILKEYIPGLLLIAIIDAISIIVNKEGYSYYGAYNLKQFIGNALMLHNMGPNDILERWFIPFGSGRPLWTLAVEWWLYMLYGAICISLSNRTRVSLPRFVIFGGILFMASGHLITGRGKGLGFVFALGVLSYYVYDLISKNVATIVFVLSCLLFVGLGLFLRDTYTVCSFILLWLVFCSAIKMGEGASQSSNRNASLAFVSKSTFMLYLIHYSIIDLIVNFEMNCSMFIKFFAGMIISLMLSFCTYYIFGEKDVIGRLINAISNRRFINAE